MPPATIIGPLVLSSMQFNQPDLSVAAGFPNPCEDFLCQPISLDELMITRPSSTFLIRVNGDSMQPTIPDGAILVVDKSVTACHGRIVVAVIQGEFVVKELQMPPSQKPYLYSHNPNYPDIPIPVSDTDWQSLIIWGVVTGFLKRF